jgi:hypothetical protein
VAHREQPKAEALGHVGELNLRLQGALNSIYGVVFVADCEHVFSYEAGYAGGGFETVVD